MVSDDYDAKRNVPTTGAFEYERDLWLVVARVLSNAFRAYFKENYRGMM